MLHLFLKVFFRIWFPKNVRITPRDPVLNLIESPEALPTNCTETMYQSTVVRVSSDFGGQGLVDIVEAVIDDLVVIEANDTASVNISGGVIQVSNSY